MTTRFCFLDTETTSADAQRGVVEVAFVITDEAFNVLEERSSLIDPEQMISPSASGIHGLVNADVQDSPTLAQYFSNESLQCYGGKLQGPLVILGHRIGFDTHTIGAYVEGGFDEVCSLRWARKLYPHAEDHKLSTLMFSLGLPKPLNAHRALADVYSAMHLVQHICERTGLSLPDLAEHSKAPMPLLMMPFGKHKGTPFAEMPKSYLRWAIENMKDLDRDLLHTIETTLNGSKK